MPAHTEFVFSLLKVAARIERRLDRTLSATKGVSFTEYHLLKELQDKHKGAATRVELASAVGLTASAITRALKPLEKIGFVITEKCERDARRSMAKLTPSGSELLTHASQIILDEVSSMRLPNDGLGEIADVLNEL